MGNTMDAIVGEIANKMISSTKNQPNTYEISNYYLKFLQYT